MDALQQAMASAAVDVEAVLQQVLESEDEPERRLLDAMRYAALGGGKRLRPFLVLQSARQFTVSRKSALQAAAAVELVHCYSLVHDDLPALDDDDLRRGNPSTHRKFGEATAILAGDALLALAFEILADPDTHADPLVRGGPIEVTRSELEIFFAQSGSHGWTDVLEVSVA